MALRHANLNHVGVEVLLGVIGIVFVVERHADPPPPSTPLLLRTQDRCSIHAHAFG